MPSPPLRNSEANEIVRLAVAHTRRSLTKIEPLETNMDDTDVEALTEHLCSLGCSDEEIFEIIDRVSRLRPTDNSSVRLRLDWIGLV